MGGHREKRRTILVWVDLLLVPVSIEFTRGVFNIELT